MDVGCISTAFFNICLHLCAPEVLVIFYKCSIRRIVFRRFGASCLHILNLFCRLRSKCRFVLFCMNFSDFGCNSGLHLVSFSKKNGSANNFKKEASYSKTTIIVVSRGSQRGRLPCALLNGNKKQQFELKMLFELFPFHFPKSCSGMLFGLGLIVNVPTSCSKKM